VFFFAVVLLIIIFKRRRSEKKQAFFFYNKRKQNQHSLKEEKIGTTGKIAVFSSSNRKFADFRVKAADA